MRKRCTYIVAEIFACDWTLWLSPSNAQWSNLYSGTLLDLSKVSMNPELTSSSCTWWSEVFACSETCWSWSCRCRQTQNQKLFHSVNSFMNECDQQHFSGRHRYTQTWVSSSSLPLFFSSTSEAFSLKKKNRKLVEMVHKSCIYITYMYTLVSK